MIIKIALPRFLSIADEDRFFSGFHGISAVREFTGVARGLNINLDGRKMSIQNIRELIALLHRYGVDLEPLAVLSKGRYSVWLKNPDAYWYKSMFSREETNGQRV